MTCINVLIANFQKQWIFIAYLAFVCIVPIKIAHGTVAIAIRNTDGVFIGADSKEEEIKQSQCKIMQINNVFFAFAGSISLSIEDKELFNVFNIATKTGTIKGTIRDKITFFDKEIKAGLEDALNKMYRRSKKEFRNMFRDETPLFAIIAGIENGVPMFFVKAYLIDYSKAYLLDTSDITYLRIKIQSSNSTETNMVMIGTYDAIVHDIEQKGIGANLNPTLKTIERWIKLQASTTPSTVELPIDILRIAPGKVGWIQHKPQCPEIKTEYFKKPEKTN